MTYWPTVAQVEPDHPVGGWLQVQDLGPVGVALSGAWANRSQQ